MESVKQTYKTLSGALLKSIDFEEKFYELKRKYNKDKLNYETKVLIGENEFILDIRIYEDE